MSHTIAIGDWGVLELLLEADPIPAELAAYDFLWRDDDRCWPVTLRFVRLDAQAAYVAVLPPDRKPGDRQAARSVDDLDGIVLAQPTSLTCFACDARFDALYADPGIPLFGSNLGRHPLVSGCVACGADATTSRIWALRLRLHT